MRILGLYILTKQSHYEAIDKVKATATQEQRTMNTRILSRLLAENLRMRKLLGAVATRRA